MGLSALIAVFGSLGVFASVVMLSDTWSSKLPWSLLLLVSIASLYGCATNDYMIEMREIDNQNNAAKEAECKKVKLATEAPDGTALYYYQPSCSSSPVYFSKSGTQRQECHSVSSGKTSRTVCKETIVPSN